MVADLETPQKYRNQGIMMEAVLRLDRAVGGQFGFSLHQRLDEAIVLEHSNALTRLSTKTSV